MKKFTETLTLNTGAKFPAVGLGTWQADDATDKLVAFALKNGYRAIDTAYMYQNESKVGKGIRDSGIDRKEIFVTTKLAPIYMKKDKVKEGVEESLKALGLEYIDLYLVHWPVPLNPNGTPRLIPRLPDGTRDLDEQTDFVQDTWATLSDLHENWKLPDGSKVLRAIGVCNLSTSNLKKLLNSNYVKPAVNQIEHNPFLPQWPLLKFCKDNDIIVTAFSPLGSTGASLLQNQTIQEIAKAKDASPAQILISWHVFEGRAVIPKSAKESRIASNFEKVDLTPEDLRKIDNIVYTDLGGKVKRVVNPDWGVKVFDEEDEL